MPLISRECRDGPFSTCDAATLTPSAVQSLRLPVTSDVPVDIVGGYGYDHKAQVQKTDGGTTFVLRQRAEMAFLMCRLLGVDKSLTRTAVPEGLKRLLQTKSGVGFLLSTQFSLYHPHAILLKSSLLLDDGAPCWETRKQKKNPYEELSPTWYLYRIIPPWNRHPIARGTRHRWLLH